MKNTKGNTKTVPPSVQVRAEYGEKNTVSFEVPMTKALEARDLNALKAAIRKHCPKAKAAEVQFPGESPEVITLSRRKAEVLTC